MKIALLSIIALFFPLVASDLTPQNQINARTAYDEDITMQHKKAFLFLQDRNELYKIAKVNFLINQYKYKSDLENYQQSEHWSTPAEFIANNSGDCEDFVIMKYFSLLKLGVDKEKLFFAITKNLSNKLHMVLLYQDESDLYVMDNNYKLIKRLNERRDLKILSLIDSRGYYIRDNMTSTKKSSKFETLIIRSMEIM